MAQNPSISCVHNFGSVLVNRHFSFIFVPQFMDAPVRTCRHAVTNAVRSTSFLSAFVGIFQVAFLLASCYRLCASTSIHNCTDLVSLKNKGGNMFASKSGIEGPQARLLACRRAICPLCIIGEES